MKALGRCPRELTGGEKAMLWLALQGRTLCNQETSHLAQLMIEGSNMGILSLTRVLNSYAPAAPNPQPDAAQSGEDAAAQLARQTIQQEEDNITRLKCYLS